jgi:dephospho-CoA kinase
VWLVRCDEAVQRRRLTGRGTSALDAGQRIEAQAGIEDRVGAAATRVLDTSGEIEETRRLVDAAFEEALAAATA